MTDCNCGACVTCVAMRKGRQERRARFGTGSGKSSYGRNSGSGAYGRGSYSFQSATFDGYPALKRHRDGKTEFFYGNDVDAEGFLEDHVGHGHAIIKNGKLIYKCRPGESTPVVDLGG